MNFDVFLLFFNAVVTVLIAAAIVIRILRREYLPVIRRLEEEQRSEANETPEEGQ